jgi:hypothetical protein
LSPRPILLLSAGRSGSNLLKSFFRPNGSILDIGEFLNPTVAAHHGQFGFWGMGDFARRLAESRPDWRAPYDIVGAYVGALGEAASGRRVLADLKYHHVGPVDALWRFADETPPAVAGFLAADAVVLHLVRRNPLARLASLKLAMTTDEWIRPVGGEEAPVEAEGAAGAKTPDELSSIRVTTSNLLGHLRRIEARKRIADLWIERHRARLTLVYEDLLDGDRLAAPVRDRLELLLGEAIDLSGSAGTQKIAPPLAELIENAGEVRAALAGTEFAWCVDADRPPREPARSWRPRDGAAGSGPGAGAPAGVAPAAGRTPFTAGGTILLCRELPEALGPGVDLAAIAVRLRAAGLRVVVASAGPRWGGSAGEPAWIPAPVWPAIAAGQVPVEPREHLELLAAIGFADPAAVAAMAAAWRTLVAAVRPDAIVADHSPGLVATLGGGAEPILAIGEARTLPPPTRDGFPLLFSRRRPLPPVAAMLAALRAVGRRAESQDAEGLARLLYPSHRVVVGLPELDPYHWSRYEALAAPSELADRLPPQSETRRLLAVLPATLRRRAALVAAIRAADPGARIVETLEDAGGARRALADASHVVCLAGSAASVAALAGGRLQLMVLDGPDAEIQARLVEQQLAGRRIDAGRSPEVLRGHLTEFCDDAYLAEHATLVAARIGARTQGNCLDMLLDRLEEILLRAQEARAARRARAPAAQPS